jgi:5-methylcytosine-specific restriction endonuclease McrBC regulatory subunit McrC
VTQLSVPERGGLDISRDVWAPLRESDDFWKLVERKVLSATALPGGGARLAGSAFVGSAICGDIRIDCTEKIPGALGALLSHSTRGIRVQPVTGPTTDSGSMIRHLVDAYLEHVLVYASKGRDWEYATRREVSSLVGGRLRVVDTVILRARGMRHRVAFDRPVVNRVTPVNRLVLAALREVETLASLSLVAETQLSRARGLAALFADCLDIEVLVGSRTRLVEQVPTLVAMARDDHVRELLSLGGALLAHSSMEAGASQTGQAPLAWFINLENLFETTIRRRLRVALQGRLSVRKGGDAVFVFPSTARLSANPDLIVEDAVTTMAIGDVKYKVWDGDVEPSDLYQLLAHAKAFDANRAFLIYPSDSFSERRMGPSVTGADTSVFAVDVLHIDEGVKQMAVSMGLCPP